VFCYDNAGVPTLEFTAWTNDTTRATALVMQDGVLSKTGALTRRYMGTFYTTSTTATEDSAANRYLFNYYNDKPRRLFNTLTAVRSTTSTSYAEISSEIRVAFLIGVSENPVALNITGGVGTTAGTNVRVSTAVAIDGTEVDAYSVMVQATATTESNPAIASYTNTIAVGRHYATLFGKVSSGTGAWIGSGTTAGRTCLSGTINA
jgi:hypothetical protein